MFNLNRFYLLVLFLTIINTNAFAQKISYPEKWWAITHPFIAVKAFKITKQVLVDLDSVKKEKIIGEDLSGGALDAFKHSYWMASLTNKINSKRALKLGIAHEKGNKMQFKKHQLEDFILPDSISSVMDLHNNIAGASIITAKKNYSKKEIQQLILELLKEGKLRVIKKDVSGNYLTCNGVLINMQEWKGKWNIPKCLVLSRSN